MTVMGFIQKITGLRVNPITHLDVVPSDLDRDPASELRLRKQQDEFLQVYNHSVYLRKELAASALRIVAGDR